MSDAGTFVKDPSTGAYTLSPSSSMIPVADNSGRSISDLMGTSNPTPSPQDSYGVFASNLTSMLKQAQQTANPTPINAQTNALQTSQTNLGNPQSSILSPFFQMESPSQSTASQGQISSIFQPAITSNNAQVQNANELLGNTTDAMKTSYDINAPQVVSPGQSTVSPSGQVVFQGHAYTPAINPTTGLPDFIDTSTGQYASAQNLAPTAGTPAFVGGVDFSGQATSTGPYATDPNYAKEVGGIYTTLQSNMPTPTAQTLDQYIQGHASKSNVTGQMIINAATQYGVDPLLLTSVLAHESDFGTSGVGATTNNPGNVGNTGTSTKNFNSWQSGVSATAAALAARMPGNTNAPQTSKTAPAGQGAGNQIPSSLSSNTGAQFSTEAASRVQKLPSYLQQYVQGGPQGVAYIDDDQVPNTTVGGMNLKDVMRAQAAAAGIPYLMASDASAIKSLGVVYQSIQNMQGLVNQTLNPGFWGGTWDMVKTGIHDATLGNAFPDLSKFNSYRDTAIKAVQGLAGGSGSGLRINSGEIEANLGNLPGSSDTIANATNKLNGLTAMLNTQLAATFPYLTTTGGNASPSTGAGAPASAAPTTVSNGVDLSQFNQ